MSSYGGRDEGAFWGLFYDLISPQQPHLLMPSPWGSGFNLWILWGHKYSVYSSNTYWLSLTLPWTIAASVGYETVLLTCPTRPAFWRQNAPSIPCLEGCFADPSLRSFGLTVSIQIGIYLQHNYISIQLGPSSLGSSQLARVWVESGCVTNGKR